MRFSEGIVHSRSLSEKSVVGLRASHFFDRLGCPLLRQLGFTAAVEEWLHSDIEKKFDVTTVVEDLGFPVIEEEMAAVLFRAIRELSMNVVKYAQAKKIRVTLYQQDGLAQVKLRDDGVGFDPAQINQVIGKGGGYGLFSIKERINYMHGHFDIQSQSGQGTVIEMSIPLN